MSSNEFTCLFTMFISQRCLQFSLGKEVEATLCTVYSCQRSIFLTEYMTFTTKNTRNVCKIDHQNSNASSLIAFCLSHHRTLHFKNPCHVPQTSFHCENIF